MASGGGADGSVLGLPRAEINPKLGRVAAAAMLRSSDLGRFRFVLLRAIVPLAGLRSAKGGVRQVSILEEGGPLGEWSLARQFAAAGGVVLVVASAVLAAWVARSIERGVVDNSALATALYVESFLSAELQELATYPSLSPETLASLSAAFVDSPLGERVRSYKVWTADGRIVAAGDPALVGRSFPVTEDLAAAWQGEVRAEFEELADEESAGERALGMPLLEIYSPVRASRSDRIIAVVELYEAAPRLRAELIEARRSSWLAVFGIIGVLGSVLYVIVRRGSRLIEDQRGRLQRQLSDLTDLASHNATLRHRIQRAAARSSSLHEQIVRRIGADLHDGPAQLLAFAALRLETLRHQRDKKALEAEFDAVEKSVKDAVSEIRTLSRGLTVPEIENRMPHDIIRVAAEAHMARTGTDVALTCDVEPGVELPDAVGICLYRFTQEGLNNAFRHAPEAKVSVALEVWSEGLSLRVADDGPGFRKGAVEAALEGRKRLGLAAMRDRVESLGGTFSFSNPRTGGAEVRMRLELWGNT